ncbi:DUF6364 family protein [Flavobacterium sp. DG2-3]|uniref:DUF6364 family protein n=1 Tax=Flavobacterium sp. DG2-3 TaxID=3068317 RepID=UPI00273FE4C5|nr:DUF6364 family protein [Flavobacterium sp. DG2-3]MDP5198037.1 DUF6364 family protein [Flavobacterium sp. DG2-3]
MDAKLTLKLDKDVIEKAKIYAAEHKHSLSLLIENYLKTIIQLEKMDKREENEISSFVKSLAVGKGKIANDFDYKKDRENYLSEKHK